MSNWIKVTDRLPPYEKFVIVYARPDVGEAKRIHTDVNGEHWSGDSNGSDWTNVTHWQPMPAPPKKRK